MSETELVDPIVRFITDSILEGRDQGLDGTTPLLEWGIINSIELVKLVKFLEERFSVTVPHKALVPDNLKDADSIARMVATLRG